MKKEQILNYIKNNDFDVQNANASLLLMDLVYSNYVNSDKVTGVDFNPVLSHISQKRKNFFYFYQILDLKKLEGINHIIYLNYLKNPGTLKDRIKEHVALELALDKAWQKYKKEPDLHLFRKIISISDKWWYYGIVGEDKGEVVNKEVAPRLAKRRNIDINEASRMMNVLSHPEKQSLLTEVRKSFLEICLDAIDEKNIDKKIKSYIKKYFWVNTDFFSKQDITKENLLERVAAEINKNNRKIISAEIKEIDNNFKKIHKEEEKIKASLKLTKEDRADISFAKLIVSWMDVRKRGMMKDVYYIFSFLCDIAKKYNLEYEDLSCYTKEEVIELVETGRKVSDKEIKHRHEDCFLVFNKSGIQRFYDQDGVDLISAVEQKHRNMETIKGAVASAGDKKKVNGKVKIVLDPLKDEFLEGDILVTSMTRVEFVPLMRKAKAIITNEGGIACHAAIVSRELGTPCIIGTKNATKILKNGDEVELDLEKGFVKIIKHNK